MGRWARRLWVICPAALLLAAGCGRPAGTAGIARTGEAPAYVQTQEAQTGEAAPAETEPEPAQTAAVPEAPAVEEAEPENGPAETEPESETAEASEREARPSGGVRERQAEIPEQEESEMPVQDLEELEALLLGDRFYYQYSLLTGEEERRLYLEILCSLQRLDARTRLSALDPASVKTMFERVMADHPEIFYVDGYECVTYTLAGERVRLAFGGSYTMDAAQIGQLQSALEAAAAGWLAGAPAGGGDYETVKYLYDLLITRTDYVPESENNQNICSVLLNGKSVCQGYAKTLQYLCQKLRIPALLVTGTVDGQGHAWDLLMLDGEWYYVDPTWGDASYRRKEQPAWQGDAPPVINYDYFCVTTEQLERTHRPAQGQRLPVCAAVQDQYYRREGLYLESADGAAIAALFARAAALGQQTVMFQCADDAIYQDVYRQLVTEQGIFRYLPPESGTAVFVSAKEQRTFCFWLRAS